MTNEKYYFNPEMEEVKTKKEWFAWFEQNKKDIDYDDVEDWWEECRYRHGLLVHLRYIIAVFEINNTTVIVEKFDDDYFSIYFDGGSCADSWEYINEYFADNFNGANLNDYITTTNLS